MWRAKNSSGLSPQMIRSITTTISEFGRPCHARLSSEYALLNKVYIQARNQTRSFCYVQWLRKSRATVKKVLSLDVAQYAKDVATRIIPSRIPFDEIVRLREILDQVATLADEGRRQLLKMMEWLTREMTTGMLLHWPVLFASFGASLAEALEEVGAECRSLSGRLNEVPTRAEDVVGMSPSPQREVPGGAALPSVVDLRSVRPSLSRKAGHAKPTVVPVSTLKDLGF